MKTYLPENIVDLVIKRCAYVERMSENHESNITMNDLDQIDTEIVDSLANLIGIDSSDIKEFWRLEEGG